MKSGKKQRSVESKSSRNKFEIPPELLEIKEISPISEDERTQCFTIPFTNPAFKDLNGESLQTTTSLRLIFRKGRRYGWNETVRPKFSFWQRTVVANVSPFLKKQVWSRYNYTQDDITKAVLAYRPSHLWPACIAMFQAPANAAVSYSHSSRFSTIVGAKSAAVAQIQQQVENSDFLQLNGFKVLVSTPRAESDVKNDVKMSKKVQKGKQDKKNDQDEKLNVEFLKSILTPEDFEGFMKTKKRLIRKNDGFHPHLPVIYCSVSNFRQLSLCKETKRISPLEVPDDFFKTLPSWWKHVDKFLPMSPRETLQCPPTTPEHEKIFQQAMKVSSPIVLQRIILWNHTRYVMMDVHNEKPEFLVFKRIIPLSKYHTCYGEPQNLTMAPYYAIVFAPHDPEVDMAQLVQEDQRQPYPVGTTITKKSLECSKISSTTWILSVLPPPPDYSPSLNWPYATLDEMFSKTTLLQTLPKDEETRLSESLVAVSKKRKQQERQLQQETGTKPSKVSKKSTRTPKV